MKNETLPEVIRHIRDLLLLKNEVWTMDDVCSYTGYEKSYVYKMTSQKKLPHYKPGGKTIFFKRAEIIDFITSNRVKTRVELDNEAENIIKSNKKK